VLTPWPLRNERSKTAQPVRQKSHGERVSLRRIVGQQDSEIVEGKECRPVDAGGQYHETRFGHLRQGTAVGEGYTGLSPIYQ